MTRRSRRLAVLAAVIAALAAWLLIALRPADLRELPGQDAGVDAGPPALTAGTPDALSGPDSDSSDGGEPAFVQSINRYPAGNRRLTDESHDLLTPGARHERRQRLPNDPDQPDPGWEVLFTADRYFISGDEKALVTLELWHEGQPVQPESVTLTARTGEPERAALALRAGMAGALVQTPFVPDEAWPDYAGPVRVTARFSADGMMPQTGVLDFHFTGSKRTPGVFSGEVADRLADGSLAFDIGVEVYVAGRFRIEANLFDALGRPFGWAQFDGPLGKGRQRVTLVFDGLLFHDAQASAPFLLTQVRGYRMAPAHRSGKQSMPATDLAYATHGEYELADFRDTFRQSPRQQRMRERYEDARQRGVKLTEPEYTGN